MTINIKTTEVSRRAVLAGLGGLTFSAAVGTDGFRLIGNAQAAAIAGSHVTPWVKIAPDGVVTIYSTGAEMGQGSMTSLAMIVAEEMDADWSKVKIEFAPADKNAYGYLFNNERKMEIVGSRAVQLYFPILRPAGAQVRKVLLINAAEKWGVDAATLKTEPGFVVNPANGQKLSYGEIAAFGRIPDPLPAVDAKELKARKDYRLIGKAVLRRDIPPKVNGTAQFAIDVQLPGMVYATALHAPAAGGQPESWNDADIKKLPGIVATVRLADGVAIVAKRFEQALRARDALKVTWKGGKAAGFDSSRALEVDYVKIHEDPAAQARTLDSKGDAKTAFANAAKAYKAEFRADYGYHAQMEPLNAVARFNAAGDAVEIWEGTQAAETSREQVAKTLGFKENQVTFHQCYMGGGFGRRTLGDYAAECAKIAREVKLPVKLIWSREEDVAYGMFRPQAFQCLEAALDGAGKVNGWKHCVVGDGGFLLQTGIRIPYYGVPNQHIELRGASHGVRVKHWRGVGHVFNVFAIEGMVNKMAADRGIDPIAFRLNQMAASPKLRKCLETVATMCDWTAARPAGRALGLSLTERSNSLGAGVVEISLDRSTGKVRVHKVWAAIDGGVIVTPDAAKANVESGIVYGLSGALHERVTVKDGAVEQSNFHDYELMRMSDLPDELHVQFVDVDTRPTGLGEAGTPFIAGAIAHGLFRLTGKWFDHMPFTPDRVLATLKA